MYESFVQGAKINFAICLEFDEMRSLDKISQAF